MEHNSCMHANFKIAQFDQIGSPIRMSVVRLVPERASQFASLLISLLVYE